jgi:hypothetical protein
VFTQPSTKIQKHFELVNAWKDEQPATFEEILASKGEPYFMAEKFVEIELEPTDEQSTGTNEDQRKVSEVKLGVIHIDDVKLRG